MNADHTKYEKQELISKYLEKLSKITETMKESFEKLNQEVSTELPIKQDNLAGETDKNISVYHRYLTRFANEKQQLQRYRTQQSLIEGELNDYYRFNWDKSTKLTETAISKYVSAHPVFIGVNTLVKDQESIVNYIEGVVGGFRDRGFAIKNLIELRKIELGMM